MGEGGPPSTNENFLSLIALLNVWTLRSLGKIMEPGTGQLRRDLEEARMFIDWLGALQQKTEGNLSSEEDSALRQVLTNLRLNYLDEVRSSRASGQEKKAGAGETGGPPPGDNRGETPS